MIIKGIHGMGLLCILLTGCTIGMKESPAWHQTASSAEKAAYFKDLCLSYGLSDGSDELKTCMVEEQRESRSAARAKMRDRNSYRPINCTSTTVGRTTSTSCY